MGDVISKVDFSRLSTLSYHCQAGAVRSRDQWTWLLTQHNEENAPMGDCIKRPYGLYAIALWTCGLTDLC